MFRTYINLTKPGIVRGNAMTAAAGFLLASNGNVIIVRFILSTLGLSLVVASACVLNNIIDRDIDKKMSRTKNRSLVTGEVSVNSATVYGVSLLIMGSIILGYFINYTALYVALFGFFAYVVMYGYFKRRTIYGTEVGSISGAIPPVVGYAAVTSSIDTTAILLFSILVAWQMPHFYAIGIKRKSDYKSAGIPILPVVKDISVAKRRLLTYVFIFALLSPLLTLTGVTGYTYLLAMLSLSFYWFYKGYIGLSAKDSKKWAGEMFGLSLLVLSVFSVLISINAWLI